VKAKLLVALAVVCYFGLSSSVFASNVIMFGHAAGAGNDLRDAIANANRAGRDNTIHLASGAYYLTNADSINVGDLDITRGNLTIAGLPGSRVTIDASDQSYVGNRVFHIWPGAHLTLMNLVITGGREIAGGGILNEGTLTLDNCTIKGNSSDFRDGGGIFNAGTLTANNCTISDNSAAAGNNNFEFGDGGSIILDPVGPPPGWNGSDGGGIYNAGTLVMNNSVVSGNSAGDGQEGFGGGNGGNGGGIYNAGKLTLTRCTISGNSSGNGGNGISGNSAGNGGSGGSGGGIFNAGDASFARLVHTSVVSNVSGLGGIGGIYDFADYHGEGSGSNGSPGADGSGPNLFGNFTISSK
jgi:hypothetical protein